MPVVGPAVGAPPPRKEGTTATAPAAANRWAMPATRSPDSPRPWQHTTSGARTLPAAAARGT